MVQLRENKSDSWYAWYGFSLCVCFLVSYPILIGFFIYLLNRKASVETFNEDKEEQRSSKGKYKVISQSFNMISTDYKTDHWMQRNFLLIILLESFLNDINYFLLQDYGIIQACLYTGTTIVFLLLGGIIYRPYISEITKLGICGKLCAQACSWNLGGSGRDDTNKKYFFGQPNDVNLE